MKLNWPQYIWLILAAWALLRAWSLHGKPLAGTHDAYRSALTTLLSGALLWFGGFFGGGAS